MPSSAKRPSLAERLRATAREVDARRLQARFAGVTITTIADAPVRQPIRIGGEVRSQHRSSPEGRRSLRVEIDDGTATAIAHFTGRNRIRGIETGRAMMVEGVARRERGHLVITNPAYVLLP